jgi:hypothetical protein
VHRSRLQQLLEEKTRHLPTSDTAHYHIVVSADKEGDWDFPDIIPSPPYRDQDLAERDAHDPQLLARVTKLNLDVLECRRECPRSSLGQFGWETDEAGGTYRWWDTLGHHFM